MAAQSTALVINLDQLGKDDIDMVGGKNASLGEMISHLSDLRCQCSRRFCHHFKCV